MPLAESLLTKINYPMAEIKYFVGKVQSSKRARRMCFTKRSDQTALLLVQVGRAGGERFDVDCNAPRHLCVKLCAVKKWHRDIFITGQHF